MAEYGPGTNWTNETNYLTGLINNGTAGQKAWANNQLGVLNAAKAAYAPVNIDADIGSYTNALDQITNLSDKASARSLDYAKQYQSWSANQAAISNEYNAAEAAKNRDWQQYMSNTAHQREVADLRAAGLNPVLSAMGGNGAAVTSGAAASAAMPSGSAGQADTSASTALVQLLGSMLSAQTAIANQAVSAKTQEAVADKYTAMSKLTTEIAAAAGMANARTAAGAQMYGADKQYQIQQDFPTSLIRVLDSMLAGTTYDWSDLGGKVEQGLKDVIDYAKQPKQSLLSKAVDSIKSALSRSSNDGNKSSARGSGRNF